MTTRVSVALIVVLSILAGAGISRGENPKIPVIQESEALAVAEEWAKRLGEANVAELEKLLSDQYLHIHATALVESKVQFLDAFRNGTRKYDPIKLEELNSRGFGSFAVVTGKFQLKAFARGRTIEGVNRFGLVIAKTPAGHEVVSFQATPIPQPK
ncbi:MAG TPA: nuclear transport factor 2 family protein [Thermodesulfobacteriota bacterium]|nr:nuclear transport factor 2 family protein [Thermodesulfobacteriota bacterium]